MSARHKITQVRIAASLLKCGTTRVWTDPTEAAKVAAAITRADVRRLINSGTMRKLPEQGSGAPGKRRYQRAGSRKGRVSARTHSRKTNWLKMVRPQRELLKDAKPQLKPMSYRKVYLMVKGGAFRSRAHLKSYLESAGYMKKQKVKQ